MPEVIHCKMCGELIRAKGFADVKVKLRRHYKQEHSAVTKKSTTTKRESTR